MQRFLINFALVVIYLNVPVFLGIVAWMLYLVLEAGGIVVMVLCSASICLTLLGFASLLDSRNPELSHRLDDQ